jgi:methionine biosynthesis protein MetW
MSLGTSDGLAGSPVRDTAYTTAREDVLDMVPPSARHILDLGCSSGALARSLKSAVPGRTVVGVELDARYAADAAQHLDRVIHADLEKLEWSEAFGNQQLFDCIIFADVLEHLVDPRRCLMQATQYLRPGGCVVVSLPNVRHVSAFFAIFVRGTFPQRDRGIFDNTHLRWFTVADARKLLAESGLSVSCMSVALRWGDVGGGFVNRILNRLPPAIRRWAPLREFFGYQICFRAAAR